MRIELANQGSTDIGRGDLVKTQHGYRLIVGGNVSYGEVSWYALDPETLEIKSRKRNTLQELLEGYKISRVIKGKNLVLAVKPDLTEGEIVVEAQNAEVEEIDIIEE